MEYALCLKLMDLQTARPGIRIDGVFLARVHGTRITSTLRVRWLSIHHQAT